MPRKNRPHTPDGRYLVSRAVLKRCTNPNLQDRDRRALLKTLMRARMAKDKDASTDAKIALGEAGPVWWDDGAPDFSNQTPDTTPYKSWWLSLTEQERESGM